MGARRKARELAMQMLFQHDLSGNDPPTILTTFEDFQKAKASTREFAARIFEGTVREMETIDSMIVAQAANWRIERMAVVDRNIMRASIYEFLYESETPKLVVLDEAIEIAKRFGNENSSKFVNGILDGILKRYDLHD